MRRFRINPMVLESLVTPVQAEKRPWEMFFLGALYASIGVFISFQIFETMAGLIAVFLTVMACIPLVYHTIKLEEEKDTLNLGEKTILREHSKALIFLIFLFLGTVFSFSLWYVFLPHETSLNLFSIQIDTIRNINSNAVIGAVPALGLFSKIFFNNIKVLMFCILFSFFYGAGAIFILIWNSSVIAVAIGTYVRNNLAAIANVVGFAKLASYFTIFSIGLMKYLIHGIPEIASYFIGGIAGGIISVAVIRHDFKKENFERILIDSADLLLIAVILLFIAGAVEVYITPLLF